MAYEKKAELTESVKGAWLEFGTFTLDAASIAAGAQGIETVTVAGVEEGDQVFVNARALPQDAVIGGAKVTAADTISVYINNPDAGGGAVDMSSLTFDVIIVHCVSGLDGGS